MLGLQPDSQASLPIFQSAQGRLTAASVAPGDDTSFTLTPEFPDVTLPPADGGVPVVFPARPNTLKRIALLNASPNDIEKLVVLVGRFDIEFAALTNLSPALDREYRISRLESSDILILTPDSKSGSRSAFGVFIQFNAAVTDLNLVVRLDVART